MGALPPHHVVRWWYETPRIPHDVSSETGNEGMLETTDHPPHLEGTLDFFNALWHDKVGIAYSTLHAVLGATVTADVFMSSAAGSPQGRWILTRMLLLTIHVIVLCMCGSVELGLRVGGSVLLPPALLEQGVDLSEVMRRHYSGGSEATPLTSLFDDRTITLFGPSVLLSLVVVVAAMIDLAQVEDEGNVASKPRGERADVKRKTQATEAVLQLQPTTQTKSAAVVNHHPHKKRR